MTSTTPTGKKLPSEHLDAAQRALSTVTENAAPRAGDDPTAHLHAPAAKEEAHTWMRSIFPYNTLQEFETAWHLGNYVLDRQTGERSFEEMSIYLGMHLLYYGSEQEKALHWKRTLDVLRDQSLKMGKQYDAPESKQHIQPFIESFHLENTLPELKEPDPAKYKTFNEFFARELKPDARPIAEPDNDRVVSSPADCRLTVFPTIELATKYWIKGFGFSLSKLLGSDDLAKKFEGGSINIARLAPQDYHRWHSPASGTIHSITDIPGTYYTVNPQAINEEGTVDVFCENKRSVMTMTRSSTGSLVAVVAVGAMLVGSIRYNPGIGVGAGVHRGQCLGAFLYGGSTVIVLYPKGEIDLDQDLVKNSTEKGCETLVRVGWRVGAGPS
ncbi:related to phosphatidylserine decarboxylase proenzyme 2 precursor [Lecanosticta acicola]|uniref:phosphatidylserine decarboxylase n=1 Tax=Lecanosticta acicola TaxID=111012 RepID=A0AAI8YTK5_9PEZI|nr:related to phosphatidylserine decarboxylase proenzyme 2 precursor [Lecanosticta acicola]